MPRADWRLHSLPLGMPCTDWPKRRPLRRHWSAHAAPSTDWLRVTRASSLCTVLLFFTFSLGFPLTAAKEQPPLALRERPSEIVQDLLDPPLPSEAYQLNDNDLETNTEDSNVQLTPGDVGNIETETQTNVQRDNRTKRSSEKEWTTDNKQPPRRVKTGDTILNIRGAVRDAIGDAGAASGTRASSRVDTFVIRPSGQRPPARDQPRITPTAAPRHDREVLVEAHSRAEIICELRDVFDIRWIKDSEQYAYLPSSPKNGEPIWMEGNSLYIARATRADAGAYRCAGNDRYGKTLTGKPTHLMIYEPVRSVYLAMDGRRLDAGNTWVPVRDKTVLDVKCVAEGGVPAPDLSWRLLAVEPSLDHRPYLNIHQTNYSIDGVVSSHVAVTAARELHNATLLCEARQRNVGSTAPPNDPMTAKLEIHVTYPPSFVISRWPGFGISLAAGNAAALRCDVDANPPARAWWLRDDGHASSSPSPLEAGDESRSSATLRWPALSPSHAGWYRCRATWLDTEYSSIGYYLNVLSSDEMSQRPTEPTVPEDEDPEHQKVDVPVGGNVQLHCPKGTVGCWWRRVVGNASESWAPAGSHHAHGVLGIKDALYQEGGEYRCLGARGPDLNRLRELKRVTLRVTGGATATALSAEPAAGGWRLECGACGRQLRVMWLTPNSGTSIPANLSPDLAQHCWRAVLHVTEPHEVWCVATSPAGGSVAVFPPRTPPPSPAPARHSVRALLNSAILVLPRTALLLLLAFAAI